MSRPSSAIRAVGFTAPLLLGTTTKVDAAPPPNASGQYHDWFRSLTGPGTTYTPCCSIADCRMVESRWNLDGTVYLTTGPSLVGIIGVARGTELTRPRCASDALTIVSY
jgi:hypothetical protein